MATVRTLDVKIRADNRQFRQGLSDSKGAMRKFGRDLASMSERMAKFALAGAAAGLTLMTRNAFEAIGSIADLSRALNISTEDLIVFHRSAELTGSSVEAMDTALSQLVRNMGKAKAGTGSAARRDCHVAVF